MPLCVIRLLFVCSMLTAGINACSAGASAASDAKPNVIVVFCDDLGYGELPAYRRLYEGGVAFETAIGSFTPTIDRLAEEGMICTRAYAHNWCAPSRQSLLSGQWEMRKSAFDGQPWLGRHMRRAGLKTAQFGKYHDRAERVVTLPHNGAYCEFDIYFGFEAASSYYRRANDTNEPGRNAKITYRVGDEHIDFQFPEEGEYLTDTLSDLSVEFINACAAAGQPFFLYVPYNAPHTPIHAKAEDLRTLFPDRFGDMSDEKLEARRGRRHTRERIMAMMYAVDRGIGRIMRALEQNGQLSNTLIVFTSDNNGEKDLSLTHPLHGYKHETFEGGTRVPYIVWSSQLKQATTKPAYYDGLVSVCDILPTALRYVDPAADLSDLMTDGTDIMPYLLGRQPVLKDRRFYTTRILTRNSNTWDGGKDTRGYTTGHSQTLIIDDYKIMKLFQDINDKGQFRYVLHHLPDMVGKDSPARALTEDYYEDNTSNPQVKARLIRTLERLLEDPDLHIDWSGREFVNRHPAYELQP